MAGIDAHKLLTVDAVIKLREKREHVKRERVKEQEERINEAVSIIKSRHSREHQQLVERHNTQRSLKHKKLSDFYQLKNTQNRVDTLKQQLENPKLLQKLTFKLFGIDRKITNEIQQLERGKANAKTRIQEAMNKLEIDHKHTADRLGIRQKSELETLRRRFKPREVSQTMVKRESNKVTKSREQVRKRANEAPNLSR